MKRILLLFFAIGISSVNAQFTKKHLAYLSGELNFGTHYKPNLNVNINLNYIYKEKHSFGLGYAVNIREPQSKPKSTVFGVGAIFLFLVPTYYDEMQTIQLTTGKIYKLNDSGMIRANLSLGVGYTMIKDPNWIKELNSNKYTLHYKHQKTISLIINPKIEIPIFRFYGITVSPIVYLNQHRTFLGIGIGVMEGLLRGKVKEENEELTLK